VLAIFAALTGEFQSFSLSTVSDRSWVAFAYLVLVGSGIAYTTYVWMLRVAPLTKIATYAYVNPIVAFVLSAIVLGEEISARTVVAAVVIVASVAIIVTARSRSGAGSDTVASIEEDEPALERRLDLPAPAGAPAPASPAGGSSTAASPTA
jgi:drug/metabolite transporter (DMT)-like permease